MADLLWINEAFDRIQGKICARCLSVLEPVLLAICNTTVELESLIAEADVSSVLRRHFQNGLENPVVLSPALVALVVLLVVVCVR